MSYSKESVWSADEVAILRACYPEHGKDWVGYESLLPNRTPKAIMRKANILGLKTSDRPRRKPPKRQKPHDFDRKVYRIHRNRDPMAVKIRKMMRKGMTLAEIDKAMRWPPDRAKYILMEDWRGESDG